MSQEVLEEIFPLWWYADPLSIVCAAVGIFSIVLIVLYLSKEKGDRNKRVLAGLFAALLFVAFFFIYKAVTYQHFIDNLKQALDKE